MKVKLLTISILFCFFGYAQNATHLNFDGTNDHIVLPNESSFDFTNKMTVEFWMKSSTIPQQWDALVTKGDGSWRVHLNSAGTVAFAGTPAFTDFSTTTSLIDNTWHHVAATYNGTTAVIYVDGVLNASKAATANISNATHAVAIAENVQQIGRYFAGNIDDVRIWNVARTQTEISTNRNCELDGNEPGLLAYYKFNQGLDAGINAGINTLIDATTNSNTGTLNGFALAGSSSNWLAGSAVTTGISCSTLSNASFLASGLNLYPNPAYNIVNIDFNNIKDKNLEIFDLNGRKLYSKKELDSKSQINIEHFQSGIYLFKISSKDGTFIQKVIKQ